MADLKQLAEQLVNLTVKEVKELADILKDELVADIIAALQSPAKNVISALSSGGNTISGVLKTLEQRG